MSAPPEQAPARFNMAAYCLAEAAHVCPTKPALIVISDAAAQTPAEVWSYADLEDAVLRCAAALKASGLEPGDRVLIRLENTSAYAILFFAAIAAGLVALPASSQLTAAETMFLLTDSGAAAIAAADDLALEVPAGVRVLSAADVARMMRHGERAAYAPTAPNDPAFVIYTSGTTAEPKGVLHAQRSALGRRPMYQGWYGLRAQDRVLHAGAFNWTFTLGTGLTDPWANGATAIIYTGEKDPTLWPRLIASTEATLFAGVPGVYRQILKYANPTRAGMPSLRHGLVAGETPPPALFEEWQERTGTELYEALGMSEISTYISSAPSVPRKPGAIGKPQPGRRVAILPIAGGEEPLPAGSEGLIAVDRSDPGLMLGYWRRPDEEATVLRGQWFIGGDLGVMDDDGYVTHMGRSNNIMKALGYRVSPLEVEAVLAQHASVAEVACAEIHVRADVSVIGAFIVAHAERRPSEAEIAAFAAERLAAYKCPREIRFVEALPRTANGKIKRSELARLYAIPATGE
jgi:acyl-coenzyme A synthetase/AMP-(fatty) acid ligase